MSDELFKELLERSRDEKRGLTVYLSGQTLIGIVTRIIGEEAIELTSQQFHRAIVRLEKIEAMSVN